MVKKLRTKRDSDLSDDVIVIKKTLDKIEHGKEEFVIDAFLTEKYSKQAKKKRLSSLKSNQVNIKEINTESVKVQEVKTAVKPRIRKKKKPATKLSKFLTLSFLILLICFALLGITMITLAVFTLNSGGMVFDGANDKRRIAVYNIVMGSTQIIYVGIMVHALSTYQTSILRIGSFGFVIFFFCNLLPIYRSKVLLHKNSLIVNRYLWTGIEYDEDLPIITYIQESYKCCGVFDWKDWRNNVDLNHIINRNLSYTIMHRSCCIFEEASSVNCLTTSRYYKEPCGPIIMSYMRSVYAFAIPFYTVQQFILFAAIILSVTLTKYYTKIAHKFDLHGDRT